MNDDELDRLIQQTKEYLASKADDDMAWGVMTDYSESEIECVINVDELTDMEGVKRAFEKIHDKVLNAMSLAPKVLY